MNKKTLFSLIILIAVLSILLFIFPNPTKPIVTDNSIPQNVTLTGTFGCLEHVDKTGPQTMECAFGFKTDGGDWYAVNFGQNAQAMDRFTNGAHVKASGNVVEKEALSTDQWNRYDMKGIFTIVGEVEELNDSTKEVLK